MSNSSAFDAILEFTQPSNGVVFNIAQGIGPILNALKA
jgi:hypothetical protein